VHERLTGENLGPLTGFQSAVSVAFFSLPASDGFLLAGGAALVVQQLTRRPTRDLDFFTAPGRGSVPAARDAFEQLAEQRGWQVRRVRDSSTFCRLSVAGPEDLIVDLALDSPPQRPATATVIGPSYDPEELAGRKVVALYDRAEARDFADVYELARRYDRGLLLKWAKEIDRGFDVATFADMLGSIARFTDDEIPADPAETAALRTFFQQWRGQLRA
jgi:hypothetical protein